MAWAVNISLINIDLESPFDANTSKAKYILSQSYVNMQNLH